MGSPEHIQTNSKSSSTAEKRISESLYGTIAYQQTDMVWGGDTGLTAIREYVQVPKFPIPTSDPGVGSHLAQISDWEAMSLRTHCSGPDKVPNTHVKEDARRDRPQ